MTVFVKDPNAVLDYVINWATWLAGDTITSSTWVVPAGITQSSAASAATTTTIWLSGGTAGNSYTVTNRIVTAGGRTDDRSLTIEVHDAETGIPSSGTKAAGYSDYADVVALCPQLFNGPAGGPSVPTVNEWIAEGDALIDLELGSQGYTVPVDATAAGYLVLRGLSAMYAAAQCEFSRAVIPVAVKGTSRGEILESRFIKRLVDFAKRDLTAVGFTYTSQIYAGGISDADTEAIEDDDDRTKPAFKRGMHMNPGSGTNTT